METIATRRPKRGAAVLSSSGGAGAGEAASSPYTSVAKRSRGGEGGRDGFGGAGGADGVAEAGGLARNEFVCRACKKAARQAVRQYGLLGALETGGIVLPYGESDVSA